jgi:hypothetical protein
VSENDLGERELLSNRAVWEVGRVDVDVVLIRVVLDVPREGPRLPPGEAIQYVDIVLRKTVIVTVVAAFITVVFLGALVVATVGGGFLLAVQFPLGTLSWQRCAWGDEAATAALTRWGAWTLWTLRPSTPRDPPR